MATGMHAIYIDSPTISGAEKRALKLCYELNKSGRFCKLIITKRLFDKFLGSEYSEFLDNCIISDSGLLGRIRAFQRLRTLKKKLGFDRFLEEIYYRNFIILVRENNISTLHIFLDLELALRIQKYTEAKVIFEITSPEYVKRLRDLSTDKLSSISKFNAVSDSTYIGVQSAIPRTILSKSPIPFFSPVDHLTEHKSIFKEKENIIIFAHRLIPRKNGLLFAHVVKEFCRADTNWTVKILGQGPQSKEINALLSEEILSGKVVTGYSSRILPELERSKIFVSIIEPDNYPSQSVLEAMYMGNALLLSDCGFTKEKFFDRNGFLCKIELGDILSKLMELIKDEERLKICGQNSLALLKSRYDKEIYLEYIYKMYSSLKR